MNLPKQLTTVTTLSKTLAIVLFVLFPIVGFYLGMEYQKAVNETASLESDVISPPVQNLPDTKEVFVPSILLANPAPYINKIIEVQAIVIPEIFGCTKRYCGPNVACCNTCVAALFLSDPSGETTIPSSNTEGSIRLTGENVGCSGMDCDIKCTPLENGKIYIVTGKFVEKTNRGGKTYYELEYISHSPVDSITTPSQSTPNIKASDTELPIQSAKDFTIRLDEKQTFERVFNEQDCITTSNLEYQLTWVCSKAQYTLSIQKFIQGLSVPKYCSLPESDILSKGYAWEVRYLSTEDYIKYKIITNVDVNTGEIFCESKGVFLNS